MSKASRRKNRSKVRSPKQHSAAPLEYRLASRAGRSLQSRKTARIRHYHPAVGAAKAYSAVGIIYGVDNPFTQSYNSESDEYEPVQYPVQWGEGNILDASKQPKSCIVCGEYFPKYVIQCSGCGEYISAALEQCPKCDADPSERSPQSFAKRPCSKCGKRYLGIQLVQFGYGEYCLLCLN